MHPTAFEFVRRTAWSLPPLGRVLEFGSREINGSVREIFTASTRYHGVDAVEGAGVEQVGDAASVVILPGTWDAVLCCEVFEHTISGLEICQNAYRHLRRGGVFVATCAGLDRAPHSVDGGPLVPGEYYCGVSPDRLRHWLSIAGFYFSFIDGHSTPGDTYAMAVK